MIIGNFKPAGDTYFGIIRTLTFTTEAVFEPIERKTDKSPDYRVTNGNTEIGAAWKETSKADNDYLSVLLDDPSLPASVQCALVKTDTDGNCNLVWTRSRRRS
jgi:uncharacterized protein (DUF736 family)